MANKQTESPLKMKKYLRPSEPWTYAFAVFGLAILTGWVQGYSKTFFIDFALGDSGLPTPAITAIEAALFFVARIVGAVFDIAIGYQVDKTKSRWGKLRPWILFGSAPLFLITILLFVAPRTSNVMFTIVWIYVLYILYTIVGGAVDNPLNCFGAVSTPNPEERGSFLSFASILKAVGGQGGMVALLIIGIIFKAKYGHHIDKQEYTIAAICCAFLGIVLTLLAFFINRERVPYTNEKTNIIESLKVVFTNKNLLMVALTKLTGFGRGVYSAVSIYIAVYLLGSKDLNIGLMLPMGVGTAVSMLIVNFLLKKVSTKKIYIGFCLYGATALTIMFIFTKIVGFKGLQENIVFLVIFLFINFLIGLQHGNTNLTPNIMIADCIDEIELKTGKRVDALCYSGVSLFAKIAAALTDSFGVLLIGWTGYIAATGSTYGAQSDDTLNKFLIIYTIIPAVFVVLQGAPIVFYDLVGDKKKKVTEELLAKRGVNEE
ncbi:MAG: MFS transporter [Eubacterium sp.]|nr:MFS transporter [Eubacterium sp.]